MKPETDVLFETSWEVCNKVGGIYTVLSTKASLMIKKYNKYITVGPYFEDKAKTEFEPLPVPREWKEIFEQLKEEGITCHYGNWTLKESPTCILLEWNGLWEQKNQIKTDLWNNYNIDSLKSGIEFEEPVLWSTAVGKLVEAYYYHHAQQKIVLHAHEWMAGASILYLKQQEIPVATSFTTHATILGRTLAGNHYDLYGSLNNIDPLEHAYKFNIQDKHLIESAIAHNSDAFTTVSEITAIECDKLLGKKPDVLVLNGIDTNEFPTVEEVSIKHLSCRERLREFLIYHFFPYYTFDIKNTLLYFISGRYEFHNKGMDIALQALSKLNETLKAERSERTIAVFIWVPQKTHGIKTSILENKLYYRHIKNFVNQNSENILSGIVYDLVSQNYSDLNICKNILTKEFLTELKKSSINFRREGTPPVCTHHLDEENDSILRTCRELGLDNKPEDKVKIIMQPVYLEGDDGLIDLEYYGAIAGCHLGIFPSYYEPWGYTPLEAAGFGIPSITTDLAGFGRFVKKVLSSSPEKGIKVLDRFRRSDEQITNELAENLEEFSKLTKQKRSVNKVKAKEFSGLADWNVLIENYIKAHNIALQRMESESINKENHHLKVEH